MGYGLKVRDYGLWFFHLILNPCSFMRSVFQGCVIALPLFRLKAFLIKTGKEYPVYWPGALNAQ